jgi:hypothetical protein
MSSFFFFPFRRRAPDFLFVCLRYSRPGFTSSAISGLKNRRVHFSRLFPVEALRAGYVVLKGRLRRRPSPRFRPEKRERVLEFANYFSRVLAGPRDGELKRSSSTAQNAENAARRGRNQNGMNHGFHG